MIRIVDRFSVDRFSTELLCEKQNVKSLKWSFKSQSEHMRTGLRLSNTNHGDVYTSVCSLMSEF